MDTQWYITVSGVLSGPYSRSQLTVMAERGQLGPHDLVRHHDGSWETAGRISWLFDNAVPMPSPPVASLLPPNTTLLQEASEEASPSKNATLPQPTNSVAISQTTIPTAVPHARPLESSQAGSLATPAPLNEAAPARFSGVRKRPASSSGNGFLVNAAAIIVGAAAAIIIYIHLDKLEARITGRNKVDADAVEPILLEKKPAHLQPQPTTTSDE